jgi:hypothetical protein
MFQRKKHLRIFAHKCLIVSVPAETRTLDPLIKSQLLYQLSYGDNFISNKNPDINRGLVGVDGFEPPTLCL